MRLVTDLNGRIASVSRGTGDLFGIEDRWLMGKPLAAFVAADGRRNFRGLMLDLARGHGPVGTSLTLQRRDGLQLDVDVEAAADTGGSRLEWLLASDGVELHQPDEPEDLTLRGVQVKRLLARLPIGVISVTEDLAVEYANPAARLLLGVIPHRAMLPEVLPHFSLRKFTARLFTASQPPRQVVETDSGRLLELEGVHAGPDGALLLLHDVTTEERRRRAEREFVTNAAHELRTPIAAILSALEVLHGGAAEVPADRELFLGHIQRETDRLASLTASLMLLARIQTGQETPSLQLVKVAPLLGEVAEALEPQNGVSVHVDCDPRVAALADAELLQQAIWNLASNAVRHTAHGEVRLEGRDLGRVSELEVRDTGSGMSKEAQAHAADRFYRAERRSGDGFGLGLPIAVAIASALEGELTIESELGVGTRVRVHLPSARLVA